jgi:hypothetical protein
VLSTHAHVLQKPARRVMALGDRQWFKTPARGDGIGGQTMVQIRKRVWCVSWPDNTSGANPADLVKKGGFMLLGRRDRWNQNLAVVTFSWMVRAPAFVSLVGSWIAFVLACGHPVLTLVSIQFFLPIVFHLLRGSSNLLDVSIQIPVFRGSWRACV